MICEKEKCTGCFCCYNSCPRDAIVMKEDLYGFIYPIIDESKCINCNICRKKCPSNNILPLNNIKKCYAAIDKNLRNRKKSSSGGIAYLLSKKIIEQGGVVYGSAFCNNIKIEHIRVDNLKDLERLRGSKYVHSYIGRTYEDAKKDLISGKKVLFIGTPCQISGIKFYLGKEYDNLFLIDIICHGVPSQQFLREEIGDLKNVDNVTFRGERNFYLSIYKNGKIEKSKYYLKSPYYDSFMCGTIYRENCYKCLYAQEKRIGDITLGDFWGLNKESKLFSLKNDGISTVLISTDKGINFFELIKDEIDYEERNIEEAIKGNKQLRQPTQKSKTATKFKKKYKKGKFVKTYKKTHFISNIYRRIRDKMSRCKIIYKVYKKLKGEK